MEGIDTLTASVVVGLAGNAASLERAEVVGGSESLGFLCARGAVGSGLWEPLVEALYWGRWVGRVTGDWECDGGIWPAG